MSVLARTHFLGAAILAVILSAPACTVAVEDGMADTKQALTASECMEKAGAQVVHGPTNECPAGYQTLGAVEDGSTTGLCCQRPESIDFQECADREGEAMLDPGSGQTYRDGCPENRQLLGWLDACTGSLCGEGGICCALVEED